VRRVAHLSDLHFGRVDAPLLDVLRRRVLALSPDLVVVSGDLTQRARPGQFQAARAFLDTLPKPQIVVPGNHDVPLYNVWLRFVRPLGRYCRYITEDLQPAYIDDEIAVVGINTARSLVFKGGRINAQQVHRLREEICELPDRITKIIVTHHPFDTAQAEERQIVGRARMALQSLAHCGADVFLSGHLHATRVGHTAERYQIAGISALVVQAGTAISRRTRHEPNAFNLLRIARRRIEVEQYVLQGDDFALRTTDAFEHRGDGWHGLREPQRGDLLRLQ
jgi:3',5'-cyclic AMP phosphodiesterase CpdA